MKLISFNTWGGRAGLDLIRQFFEKYQETDVFCLQEIWQTADPSQIDNYDGRPVFPRILEEIDKFLPNHRYFFRPQYRGIYGLATFVHKDLNVNEDGELFVFKEQGFENPVAMGNHARNIQYVTIEIQDGPLTIINFHGLWNGQGKTDSPDRIRQSEKIAGFIKTLSHPFILAGDFNLDPGTISLKALERVCCKNLIGEHNVISTRSSFYKKPGKFADYILTGDGVKCSDFEVLPDEASDHLGLYLSFSLEPILERVTSANVTDSASAEF